MPIDEPLGDRVLRFLVVDDTADVRQVMARSVERQGCHVTQAADGKEAVEALQRESFDIMLLDLTMPRMSGEDVVRWIRSNPEAAGDVHVVVVSAWAGDKRAALLELGVTDILPKPLRRAQLEAIIAARIAASA